MRLVSVLTCALVWCRLADAITNYCELSCGHRMHTVCMRMWNCGPVPGCMPILSDNTFRRYMQKAHNRLRNRAAGGDSIFKQLPTAANMNSLIYDIELEYIAMCWANTCPITVDQCGVTRAYPSVTQIVYFTKQPVSTRAQIFRMVYEWYKQKIYLDDKIVSSYVPSNQTRHVGQLLWARTRYFGCFRVRNASGMYLVYCNYATGGLIAGHDMYKIGLPLSECFMIYPPCTTYRHLCGYLFDENSSTIIGGPLLLTCLSLVLNIGYRVVVRLRATCSRAKLVLD